MKLNELITKLTDIRDDLIESGVLTSEVQVLCGVQPSYPLTNVVVGVISGEELADYSEERPLEDPEKKAVWLALDAVPTGGVHSAYAPRALWDAVR